MRTPGPKVRSNGRVANASENNSAPGEPSMPRSLASVTPAGTSSTVFSMKTRALKSSATSPGTKTTSPLLACCNAVSSWSTVRATWSGSPGRAV